MASNTNAEENMTGPIKDNQCVICGKGFRNKTTVTADVSKLDKLVSICKVRKDECAKRILANITQIYQGQQKVRYHKTCRTNYRKPSDDDRKVTVKETFSDRERATRSVVNSFSWTTQCFICGGKCDARRYRRSVDVQPTARSWSLVTDETGEQCENVFSRVLGVAEKQNDTELLLRLKSLPDGDLSNVKARYHRKWACTKYIADTDEKKISTRNNLSYISIAESIKEEIEHRIFNEGQLLTVPYIRDRFNSIAKQNDFEISETYLKKNMQSLLKSVMPRLKFLCKPGKVTLICSDEVSVDDTLRNIYELSNDDNEISTEGIDTIECPSTNETEETILHRAAHILKIKSMARVRDTDYEYFSPKEMSRKAQEEFVDPLLYQFVQLLAEDDSHLDDTNICNEMTMKKCLSISCDLTTLITNVCSPKHLGLAVHFHNECGSRHIIDDLNNLGHCIHYDEVRRFLTSDALYTIKEQRKTRSGGLVPKEVLQRNDGGGLIVGAGDNLDHNERTIDGKRTTHAMTSILVGDSPGQISETRLPRCNDKTLRLSSINEIRLHEVSFYKKPHIRPEPIFREPVVEKSELVVKEATTTAVQVAKMRERLYSLGRSADIFYEDVSMENKVPPWSIYQSNFGDKVNIAASAISFNPILMTQPTDYSTIYTTLLRMKEVMNEMDQEFVPVFFDMGLLTKALEIVWAKQDTLSGVIPCEGGMHLLMCFFAAVGKLYGESGLRNILSESGAYASGTVDMILKGKDFDRAMLAYKVLDEVLTKIYLKQFLNWCKSEDKAIPHEVTEAIQMLIDTTRQRDDAKQRRESIYDEGMLLTLYDSIEPLLDEYNKHGREKSPTFMYWEQFLNEVLLPFKLFVASTRLGDWKVNQASKKYMHDCTSANDG